MCGICGKINFDRDEPSDAISLARMTDRIGHRGPDGTGEYIDGPVALGHRRLSIIDLSTGNQPMSNEDGMVWVVFNGEIYNFKELRGDLMRRGHRFKSSSDTEVIVHLYEEFGEDCVRHMQGMFAFALWDRRRHSLLLARDRVGIKPLYYATTGRSLVFASEIKALLADPGVPCRLDLEGVDRFLTYHYGPGDRTPFDGIFKLDPGHTLMVRDGHVAVQRYWDLATAMNASRPARAPTLRDSAEELRELLSRTVRSHMMSDVGVGVLLSGGVDSSGILHFAAKHAQGVLHTFTVGFEGTEVVDERPYAGLAAKTFGSHHHETTLSAEQFRDFLPHYVWHMEELVCEPPAVALHHVAQMARRSGVKVLLSGEGGDEAFGGYQNYRNLLVLEALKAAFGPARGALSASLHALQRAGWSRGDHYACLVHQRPEDYYLSRTATPDSPFNRDRTTLYRAETYTRLSGVAGARSTSGRMARVSSEPLLNRLLYTDTTSWLPDDLLVKADKMTMAASIELRVPLLDHMVLEFAARLPPRHKVSGWTLKRVLREALASAVPEPILRRKKKGFPVPYSQWMRRELRDFVHDTVLASNSLCDTLFAPGIAQSFLAGHAKDGSYAKEVFSLLMLNLWYEQFFRTRAAAPARGSDHGSTSPSRARVAA